ncbi:MAG: hypothetical protein J6X18_08935 [Bacteroidales bacterium]|nr:hypothetical protein [Bacteroidales bacterium]
MKKILFNDKFHLTEAVLNGQKTMTRRIVPIDLHNSTDWRAVESGDYIAVETRDGDFIDIRDCGNYSVGEVVAIAQSYSQIEDYICHKDGYSEVMVLKQSSGWNNKMFVRAELMPHHIRITDIKVERMQDISDEDCLKEGVGCAAMPFGYYVKGIELKKPYYESDTGFTWTHKPFKSPREAFAVLIDKVSGKGTWENNPWVFVYSFELID